MYATIRTRQSMPHIYSYICMCSYIIHLFPHTHLFIYTFYGRACHILVHTCTFIYAAYWFMRKHVYFYMHLFIYDTFIPTYACIHTYTCTVVYWFIRVHSYMPHIDAYVYIYILMYTYTFIYWFIRIHVNFHVYIYIHILIHTYTFAFSCIQIYWFSRFGVCRKFIHTYTFIHTYAFTAVWAHIYA